MNRLPFLLAGAVAFVGGMSGPGVASAKTVATGGPTAVREYAGTLVFSQFDQASTRWYLAVRRAGAGDAERLPIAPSVAPFAADIGPGGDGRPTVIYQRCGTAKPLAGCDLFTFSLADGAVEQPLVSANNPDQNDINPTIWRRRIAWTRDYGGVNPVVYTKRLTVTRSQRSQRLPGVPRRRCGDVEPKCGATTQRSVEALELWGDNLAVTVRYQCPACSGISQTELRLDSVSRRSVRQVAFQVSGLSGQSLMGPSFRRGRLSWYKTCLAEPAGCRLGGPYRYTLSKRRYEKGDVAPVRVYGFVDAESLLYEVVGCSGTEAGFDAGCVVHEAVPPRYQPIRAPRR